MSKISELSDGGSLLPTDFLIAVRSGGNVKVQADQTEFDRIRLGDNEKIELGNSQDMELYFSGSGGFINNTTGDLTLDVAGDIILDADGDDIQFKAGAFHFASITKPANNGVEFRSIASDKDIFFIGNDGGSDVTMLTLDASEAGAATFNAGVTASTLNTTSSITSGTGITAGGEVSIAPSSGTAKLRLTSQGTGSEIFTVNGQIPGVANGGFAIRNETDSRNDFTIDAAGAATFSSSVTANPIYANSDGEGSVYAGILQLRSSNTASGHFFRWDVEGEEAANKLVGYWNDGSYRDRLSLAGNNGETVVNDSGLDVDFRVESSGNANMLFVDGGGDGVGIGTNVAGNSTLEVRSTGVDGTFANAIGFQYSGNSSEANTISTAVSSNASLSGMKFNISDGGGSSGKTNVATFLRNQIIFNGDSNDQDFRVESSGNTHMLFVDGGNDRIGVGVSPTARFEIQDTNNVSIKFGDLASYPSNVTPCFIGTGTSALAGVNGDLVLVPRTNDQGKIIFATGHNGAASENMRVFDGGVTINDGGNARDFRVESNDNADMLKVDGTNNRVGIGKSPASNPFEVGVYAQFDTGMVVNEGGNDSDFRVESDTHAHAIFLDAGNSRVGINESAPDQALTVNGTIQAVNSNVTMIDPSASATVLTPPRGYSYINVSRSDTTSYGLLLLVFRTSTVLTIVSTVDDRSSSKYSASTSGTGLVVTNDDLSLKGFYASCVSIGFGTGD